MKRFIGEHTVKIDDKGRVILPAAFKSVLPVDGTTVLFVKKNDNLKCLELYTEEGWDEYANLVKSKLDLAFNNTHKSYWRRFTSNCATVEPDAKLGRFSIPKKLLEQLEVNKEVTFYGNDHKIEIWAKENFETSMMSQEEFDAITLELSRH